MPIISVFVPSHITRIPSGAVLLLCIPCCLFYPRTEPGECTVHTKKLSQSSLQIVRNGLLIYDLAQARHLEISSSVGHLAVLNVCVKLTATIVT